MLEASSGRRRCLVGRAPEERDRMVRFVLAPDGTVVADVDERLPGRGMWVRAERSAVEQAVRRNLFAKAAGAPTRAPADLPVQVEAAIRRRCLDLLGLARRAGLAVAGFDQVEAALRAGGIGLLLIARDAAGQADKLIRSAGGVPVVRALERAELGRVFGREEAVYVALREGGLVTRLLRELGRLEGLASPAAAAANGGGTREGGDDR